VSFPQSLFFSCPRLAPGPDIFSFSSLRLRPHLTPPYLISSEYESFPLGLCFPPKSSIIFYRKAFTNQVAPFSLVLPHVSPPPGASTVNQPFPIFGVDLLRTPPLFFEIPHPPNVRWVLFVFFFKALLSPSRLQCRKRSPNYPRILSWRDPSYACV